MFLKILSIAYWLAVAVIPFGPIYLGQRLIERIGYSVESDCFSYAVAFVSEQGVFLVVSATLLWPIVVFKLWQILRSISTKAEKNKTL